MSRFLHGIYAKRCIRTDNDKRHATGFSGHGFMLGPVSGQVMAALLNGTKPIIDPTIMDYHRFERGEKIVEPMVV